MAVISDNSDDEKDAECSPVDSDAGHGVRPAAQPDGHCAAHASLKGRGSARRHPGLCDADEADNLANSERAQRRASSLAEVEKNMRGVVCPVGFEPTTR